MVQVYFSLADIFAAKSGKNGEWLSVRQHLLDTMGVMEKLLAEWVPGSVKKAAGFSCENFDQFDKLAVWLAGVHDIGKCTLYFQEKISYSIRELRGELEKHGVAPKSSGVSFAHNLASGAILNELGVPEELCAIAAAHHGRSCDEVDFYKQLNVERLRKNYYSEENKDLIEKVWRELYEQAVKLSGYDPAALAKDGCSIEVDIEAQIILSGLLIVADWIASNAVFFPLIDNMTGIEEICKKIDEAARVEEGWKKVDLPPVWESSVIFLDENLFQGHFGFRPREMQVQVYEAANYAESPGLFIIEAAMGTGKTEAALAVGELLAAKSECGGLFIGLPTKSTANGLFSRVRNWGDAFMKMENNGEKVAISLAHGDALFNEEYEQLFESNVSNEDKVDHGGVTVNAWLSGRRKQLLSSLVVGTVDQALAAALATKFVMLRHLGLTGKVVIIDEVHSYDAYMYEYLECLIRWLGAYHIPVVLLSATLAANQKARLLGAYLGKKQTENAALEKSFCREAPYPCLTYTDNGEVYTKELAAVQDLTMRVLLDNCLSGDFEEFKNSVCVLLRERMQDGGCAGVIVNTVHEAQELCRCLKDELPNFNVILVHSRFLPQHRTNLENKILKCCGKNSTPSERDRIIVIGTQVLEQSLDLDFDLLITQMCPIDLLLQRVGRLHRHRIHDTMRPEKLATPVCYIWDDGNKNGVYDIPPFLDRTRKILGESYSVRLPQDIRTLVDSVYEFENAEEAEELQEYLRKQHDKKQKADFWSLPAPECLRMPGLVKSCAAESDEQAAARVRDGDDGLRVLLLKYADNDRLKITDWQCTVAAQVDVIPGIESGKTFMKQQLTLPWVMTNKRIVGAIDVMDNGIREWKNDHRFEGQFVVLAEADGSFELGQFKCHYDDVYGFSYQ